MEIYKDLSSPASQKFEELLNTQLSKNKIEEGKIIEGKVTKITICAVIIVVRVSWPLFKFIKKSMKFIKSKWIVKSPLKPSIKLAPFIINNKHKRVKAVENKLLPIQIFKNLRSIDWIAADERFIKINKEIIINNNLYFGLILNFISSKKPIENINIDRMK